MSNASCKPNGIYVSNFLDSQVRTKHLGLTFTLSRPMNMNMNMNRIVIQLAFDIA